MGEANRFLAMCFEKTAYLLSRINRDVPAEWLWAGLGVSILLLFWMAFRNRSLKKKVRRLEAKCPKTEVTASGPEEGGIAATGTDGRAPEGFQPEEQEKEGDRGEDADAARGTGGGVSTERRQPPTERT